jgi:hypothetical protein
VTLERINEFSPRSAAVAYGGFMTVWVVAFANTEGVLPGILIALLLLLPGAVSFSLGYVVGKWWALYLTAVPIVAAAVVGGLPSPLWAAVVLLTAFPGAPLVVAGVYVRDWLARRDSGYVDPWLI